MSLCAASPCHCWMQKLSNLTSDECNENGRKGIVKSRCITGNEAVGVNMRCNECRQGDLSQLSEQQLTNYSGILYIYIYIEAGLELHHKTFTHNPSHVPETSQNTLVSHNYSFTKHYLHDFNTQHIQGIILIMDSTALTSNKT